MSTLQFLAEWAVRSSVLVLAGALVLWVLRVKDSSIRLAAWVALLCGSVALPLMTVSLPAVPVPVARPVAESVLFFDSLPAAAAAMPETVVIPRASFDWARAGVVLYFAVMFGLLLRLAIGLAMSRRLLRQSRAACEPGVRESDELESPATLGILRPVIVLPVDWTEWDEAKLAAVLAHERSHIARFDPAVQLVSALHRAALWFSPASWLLHSRIVRVAEEASDDAAVAATLDRISYAEILLEFTRRGICEAGVPMARYGSADKRIYRILDAASLSCGVTRWSVVAIVMLGVPLAYLAASVTPRDVPVRAVAVVRAAIPETLPLIPQFIAQVQAPSVPKPPAPASPAVERPKFDVASVRPCDPNYVPPGGRGRGGGGGGGTGIFRLNCTTVMSMIANAYIRFAGGEGRSMLAQLMTKIDGGPEWLNTDKYTIEAESEAPATIPMEAGPMMQTLLEDRFQLKVHRENREGPVYALTLAKSGSKTLAAKGTPCVASDYANAPMPFRAQDDRPCQMMWIFSRGPNMVLSARGSRVDEIIPILTGVTGRLVVDKTGMVGNIDIDLIFAPEDGVTPIATAESAPTADDPLGPSIFTVLERVGLKLESARGSREYLVIDSVSRPSEN